MVFRLIKSARIRQGKIDENTKLDRTQVVLSAAGTHLCVRHCRQHVWCHLILLAHFNLDFPDPFLHEMLGPIEALVFAMGDWHEEVAVDRIGPVHEVNLANCEPWLAQLCPPLSRHRHVPNIRVLSTREVACEKAGMLNKHGFNASCYSASWPTTAAPKRPSCKMPCGSLFPPRLHLHFSGTARVPDPAGSHP